MNLIQGSVREAHAVIVVVLLLAIFGYISLQTIPVQLKPSLDKPEIKIETNFRGASPFEVEEEITKRIEEEMDSVEGVNKVTSTSLDGISTVTLEFDWGVDKDAAMVDVNNKLNQVPDFPEDADRPVVSSVTSESSEPVMWIVSESSSMTPNEMYELVEDVVEPQMRRIKGVGDIWVFGGEARELQIRVDPEALVSRHISITQFVDALRRENMNVRGGFVDEGKRRYTLRTVGQFNTMEKVQNVIIARGEYGSVYLKDVADVRFGYKKTLSTVHNNGDPTVVMGLLRKSGANVVELSQAVKARMNALNTEFRQKQQDYQMAVAYTDETYIAESVDLAWRNLFMGGILASIVLLLFLKSFRSLLVVAITIPVCLITVFIFLKGFGRSLNIISLAGLAFSSGMIVDNAIVVIENIYRHLGMGKSRIQAALDATKEVWGAILISSLTTLAVFVPIIFIQEEAGQLFKDIAIAICLAITLSLFAAITVIPMMTGRLCHAPATQDEMKHSKWHHLYVLRDLVTLQWLGGFVSNLYKAIIHWLLGHTPIKVIGKLGVIVGIVGLFIASLKLLPPANYLPSGNRNLVLVFAQPLVGSNLQSTLNSIRPFEMQMLHHEKVERFFTVFGQQFNAVGIIVKPEYADERSMQAFVGECFGRGQSVSGFESIFPVQMSIFRDPGKQIEIDVIGPSLERLQGLSKQIEGQLYGMGPQRGILFVRSSFHEGSPEVQVALDRERCAQLGLRVEDVSVVVEGLIAGKVIGEYNDQGKQIDLTVYARDGQVESRNALSEVVIRTPSGKNVRLDTIAKVMTTTGPTSINHSEKERSITLTVNLTPDAALEDAIANIENEVLNPIRASLPGTYFIRMGGTADKLSVTLKALTSSFALAVIIVYLLMVALFRSWTYPFVIIVTIPMAMSGAFIGITAAHKWSGGLVGYDVIAMLGLIILSGIVVNNAILIVHQALNFQSEGMSPGQALRESCDSRLRPICMSILTSVLGMLPLAIGQGSGSELYRGLGAVMIGGLLVSTLFTLFLVPTILSLVQEVEAAIHHRKASE